MKKNMWIVLCCAFCMASVFAVDELRISALNGPSGISMGYLFENVPVVNSTSVSYEVAASADVLLPKLLKGEVDIGILPPNAAAKVYNANKGALAMGAVVGEGMLTVVSTDSSVSSLADLKGKKLTVAGQGATPEYMIRFLASKAGINCDGGKDGIELDFSIPNAEIAAAMAAGKIQNALVPEPFATVACMNAAGCRRAINIQSLWTDSTGLESYPMTVVVMRSDFAAANRALVVAFLDEYKAAIAWTNENPAAAGQLVEKHTLGLKAPIVTKAIPNAAFRYLSAADARTSVESLLNVFLSFAPASIGGKLPADSFYFSAE